MRGILVASQIIFQVAASASTLLRVSVILHEMRMMCVWGQP